MSADAQSCRLCDESTEQMYDIFESNEYDVKIIQLIQDCLPILIYENDPLSKYICRSCIDNLNMFADFKKTCTDIAKKHRNDLERTPYDPVVRKYLNKLRDFEVNEGPSRNGHFLDTDMEIDSMDDVSQTSYTTQTSQSQNGDLDGHCMLESSPKFHKKPRMTGPKSKTTSYTKVITSEEVFYQPLALKELVVQSINVQNITDFNTSFSHEDITLNETILFCCRYCNEQFEEEAKLAIHELEQHIQLHLQRVDSAGMWNLREDDARLRNQWVANQNDEDDTISVGQDELLIPISEEKVEQVIETDGDIVEEVEEPVLDFSRNGKVYFVGEVAHARGIPLTEIPKEERNSYYQSVLYGGARRKFCQLCRFLFRDNWSIDMHYLQSSCMFSCHFCGEKFKRNRYEMPIHIEMHENAGHQRCTNVFVHDKWGQIKEVSTSTLSPYQPTLSWIYQKGKPASPSVGDAQKDNQVPKERTPSAKMAPSGPSTMQLRVRSSLPAPPTYDEEAYERRGIFIAPKPPIVKKEVMTSFANIKDQAYFCKKCYQVFTKLANYNIHVSKCMGENHLVGNNIRGKSGTVVRKSTGSMVMPSGTKKIMPALNPLPIPVSKIKQEGGSRSPDAQPTDFPCNYCDAVFPTVYSRNSHMRVHVWGKPGSAQKQAAMKRAAAQQVANQAKRIKSESNFEPIVEIHEGATTTIGSVSITPLRKTTVMGVRPDVMKLVENNPNISFKPRNRPLAIAPKPESPLPTVAPPPAAAAPPEPQPIPEDGDVKGGYKCASCLQYFANKSNLYFHKKNQCTGSRFPCPFCKKRFGTASEYSSHIFYSHPE